MYPMIRAVALSTLFVLVLAGGVVSAQPQVSVTTGLTSMPLTFTENQGQWDDQVKFRANGGGAAMWFTSGGAYYQFTRRVRVAGGVNLLLRDSEPDEVETMMIGVSFVGANPNPRVVGENLTKYKCNYFIGNDPSKWQTDVPNYRTVVYEDIYPGIDLKYYGNGTQMEYDFVVPPFADYSQIKIRYDGSLSMSVSPSGELVIRTKWGTVVEQRPVVYQVVNNLRVPVEAEYLLKGDNCFGFQITGDYDRSLPLVIDPILTYSTYLGGDDAESGSGIAVDGSGCAYITGTTYSTDFPTKNPYQTYEEANAIAVFVTKLGGSGDGLVYSTYLGGGNLDAGHDITVDGSGCAYVAGRTSSIDFPTLNPYQTYQGGQDAFVTKLNSSGNGLVYSTYLGGSTVDAGRAIAVDGSGCAYVTGSTYSTDFPTLNAYQTFQGLTDAFVTKFSSSGSTLDYSTYLGGSGVETGQGIAVDGAGFAFVTGRTSSTDYPTENAYQTDPDPVWDNAFVTKLNSSGDGLVYSTYLGGDDVDAGTGIAVDNVGCAYVTGNTLSTDFPTENPYQTDQGDGDAFVTKFSSSGTGLVYSTYLGGSGYDVGSGIAVDDSGSAHVTGRTNSIDFPTVNPYQTYEGNGDVFVTRLSSVGNGLVYSTYLGGGETDGGNAIAVDGAGSAYVTGGTESTDFPTVNPYQSGHAAYTDAFIAKFTPGFAAATDYPVGDYPLSIVSADLDGDDDKDLAVADYESDSISILFNNGDGSFAAAVNYPSGDGPRSICAADVDNDTDIDLAVANEFDNNVSIYINNGSGVFAAPASYACGTGPVAVCGGYLDDDAFVDLVVANFSVDSMYILFNDGDGTFDGTIDGVVGYGTGNGPRSVFTADLDNDSDEDVAVANEKDDDVSIFLNDGHGGLSRGDDVPVGNAPVSVTGADLDDDGDQDLAVANYTSDDVSVLTNDGDATFDDVTDGVVGYGTGNGPRSVFTADLDSDNDKDLVTANELSDDVSVLDNNGDATFDDAVTYEAGDGPVAVVADDLDGDGDLDLATVNCESDDVSILFNLTGESICCGIRGDFDHNASLSPLDAIAMVNYLWSGGAGPVCYEEADVNDSGGVDPMDAVYMVNYFWLGGPAPVPCP